MIFADGRLDPESFRDGADRRQDSRVPGAFATRTGFGGGRKFFNFFARNPLKSHDSAKVKQGNASQFAWIYLDSLS
jgi:hypothetical protein